MSAVISKVNELQNHFLNLIDSGKLSHAYLFLGRDQDQIHSFIAALAARILDEKESDNVFENGQLMQVDLLAGKQTLSVDQMRELRGFFSEKSSEAQIAVIDHADQMTDSAANSILKFIEEPFENQFFFLQASRFNQVLPTILSRVQLIRMPRDLGQASQSQLMTAGLSQEDALFVSQVASSFKEAQSFLLDAYAINLKHALDQWLRLIFAADDRAFAYVQTNLTAFADSSERESFFARAVSVCLSSILQQRKDLIAAQVLDCWLAVSARTRFNVAWQVILETFVLKSIRICNGTEKLSDK